MIAAQEVRDETDKSVEREPRLKIWVCYGTLGTDGVGNVVRIDNIIDGLEGALTTTKQQRENTQVQFETAKEEIKKPFAKEEELKQKEARLNELNALLNVDKKENDLVDDAPDEGNNSPSKKPIDRDAR